MLRSARLQADDIKALKRGCRDAIKYATKRGINTDEYEKDMRRLQRQERQTEVRTGDRMTGWEIIASLPLEEQINLTRSAIMTVLFDSEASDKIMITELSKLHEWNGTEWTEVNE